MPVATIQSLSVLMRTVAGNENGWPSGYMKTFVPLNSRNSSRAQDIALSSVSALKLNDTCTGPGPAVRMRQVS